MPQSLGRGLSSLIPKKTVIKQTNLPLEDELVVVQDYERIVKVSPDKIVPNPQQPRQNFSNESLSDLAKSIKSHGIIQPLIVTRKGTKFELIAGERRLRSARILELKEVPVIIRAEKEQEKLELALIENLQREDLNPLETALAYQQLIDEFNITQEEVAHRVAKARSSVTNTLRLLSLPPLIQTALVEGRITEAHAKYLLGLDNNLKQTNMLKKILRHKLSVAETNQEIRRLGGTKGAKSKNLSDQAKEKELSEILSTKVEIRRRGQGGRIIIDFFSEEELANILDRIK